MTDEPKPNGGWRVDRTIPLALIVTMFVALAGQAVLVVTWKAQTDVRLDAIEKHEAAREPQEGRLVRVETMLQVVTDRLAEIKGLLTPVPQLPSRR